MGRPPWVPITRPTPHPHPHPHPHEDANGKGAVRGSRQDLRGVNTTHKNYRQQAAVLLPSETHGTEDVGKSDFIYSYLILFLSSLVSSS